MKLTLVLSICLFATQLFAQTSITPLDCVEPFYHNVASGDPLEDRVIIWTRVTPTDFTLPVDVDYQVALDTNMTTIIASGTVSTDASVDYTVKIDVTGLSENTYYYYEFKALGKYSPIGRTKTTPSSITPIDSLRFAVVSCANLEGGYFNVYEAVANRNDVDAVLMLGDYIYEYEEGGYSPNSNVDRIFDPTHETVTLDDYRLRYSVYHMDRSLAKLHQNFPWICVWDDHESADNSYTDGAENHNAGEGLWLDRKNAAMKAYFEWLPIRPKAPNNYEIFRSFSYGNLLDLFMVDTRLHGREEQGVNESDPNRTMLGVDQYQWLKTEMLTSSAQWKVLGNQVIFSPVTILGIPINNDSWDGYPAERQNFLDFLVTDSIGNFVVLTGDIHTSWGINIENGSNNVGVEFVTPSVTSPGIPINLGGLLTIENPHIKYVELTKHGFILLDVNSTRIQSEWYFINTIDAIDPNYTWDKTLYSNDDINALQATSNISTPSSAYTIDLAPVCPRFSLETEEQFLGLIGLYPNPVSEFMMVHFSGTQGGIHSIQVVDLKGRLVQKRETNVGVMNSRITELDLRELQSGIYILKITDPKGNTISSKFIKD